MLKEKWKFTLFLPEQAICKQLLLSESHWAIRVPLIFKILWTADRFPSRIQPANCSNWRVSLPVKIDWDCPRKLPFDWALETYFFFTSVDSEEPEEDSVNARSKSELLNSFRSDSSTAIWSLHSAPLIFKIFFQTKKSSFSEVLK